MAKDKTDSPLNEPSGTLDQMGARFVAAWKAAEADQAASSEQDTPDRTPRPR